MWCTRPVVQVPAYSGRGQPPKRQRLAPGEASAQTISNIVANLQPQDWSTHVIKEGAKGPMVAEFAALRVINRRHKLPDAEVWLLVRFGFVNRGFTKPPRLKKPRRFVLL